LHQKKYRSRGGAGHIRASRAIFKFKRHCAKILQKIVAKLGYFANCCAKCVQNARSECVSRCVQNVFPGAFRIRFQVRSECVSKRARSEYVSRCVQNVFPGAFRMCFQVRSECVSRCVQNTFPGAFRIRFQVRSEYVSRCVQNTRSE
jgi:hypothetical protein